MSAASWTKADMYRRIVLAKLYMDEHYAQKISLEKIAAAASFSKFHFLRLFTMVYGKSPHQYLSWVRIEKSKRLLQNGMGVMEVSCSVGFEEGSSFIHLFKKFNHITPSQYQRKQQQRQSEMTNHPLKFIPGCFAQPKGWIKK